MTYCNTVHIFEGRVYCNEPVDYWVTVHCTVQYIELQFGNIFGYLNVGAQYSTTTYSVFVY